jgi:hypothetical protein
MKEQIIIKIEDLNDEQQSLEALLQLFEKVLFYYEEKDIKRLNKFVAGMLAYWYLIYQMLQESQDEGEQNEN